MRKALKKKARSCAMCKPHKTRGANRWKPKEEDTLRRTENEIRDAEGR